MTARDIIKGALRLIGAIASGETPTASDEADALSALNDIIVSWGNDGLMINQRVRESFTLIPSQQVYTIGATGNFDTSWPSRIMQASIKKGDLELPVAIINEQEWAQTLVKDTSSSIPQRLYADGAYPLLNLNLWPVPSEANDLILYSLKPFAAFANATDTVDLPPGYARCLRYNLAGELAAEYGMSVNPVIAGIAVDSKAEIRRQNTQPVLMSSDVSGLVNKKTFNWLTGE